VNPILAVASWAAFAAGCALLIITWMSVIGTLIVPRPLRSRLSTFSGLITFRAFRVLTAKVKSYEARDRILAWQSPMSLFVRLAIWMVLFDVAYTLVLLPLVGGDLLRSFDEAGSAMFTLGYAAPDQLSNTVFVYLAAFTGLVVVALQVGYLPTLYSAFNRRESEVTLLVSRAGAPSWGPELLIRTRFGLDTVDGTSELGQLYATWERWSAEVAESHSTYLTLCWLRSPGTHANWLISLLSVMDAAALQLSLSPSTAPNLRARLFLRMGFTCVNQVARALAIPVEDDADPDGPIAVTFEEFRGAVEMLRSVGYPVETTAEQAWPHFRGWRVNYERAAYAIAFTIDAPPALWSGPRRFPTAAIAPGRPANRVSAAARADDPQLTRRRRPAGK
jgi:hypothetical protein